ncbi:MAG: YcaQ family DNA glycosylase [Anaerolineales bacterium]|nr:YcaQ family DNA glycosylase [Anaerolineales bacterium]
MAKSLPTEVTVSVGQARRYLVAYQRLAQPRTLKGKAGALEYIRQVNCIQFDPINVVGQNPHLVLQSRVRNYRPALLDELLYRERSLVDGFDKVMSIYPREDWPFFNAYRAAMGQLYKEASSTEKATRLLDWVREEIRTRGPLSALELEDDTKMDWWLTGSARAVRIALDILFYSGEVVIHHRVANRRYFELATRVLGEPLTAPADPHEDASAYREWHVLRRIESMGLARPQGNGQWGGIQRSGSLEPVLARLVGREAIARVGVEGVPGQVFYLPRSQLAALQRTPPRRAAAASFLAPLDNLLWDRDLLEQLFGFYYRWEVYVPEAKRQYGYYVLPVLYGDAFVARFDPGYDRKTQTLTIKNWWWQPGVPRRDEAMQTALAQCLRDFMRYLGAQRTVLGAPVQRERTLKAIVRLAAS